MERLEARGSRASGRLAVKSDNLALPVGERWERELNGPVQKQALPGLWLDDLEDPLEGVLAGNSVLQGEKASQPLKSVDPKGMHQGVGIGTTDHRQHADHYQIYQPVSYPAWIAWIVQERELFDQARNICFDVIRTIHPSAYLPDFAVAL